LPRERLYPAHAAKIYRTTRPLSLAFVPRHESILCTIGADGIAARHLNALKQHYSGKLKLRDVKEMFHRMRKFA
jgi:hypothetical protein